MSHCFVGMLKNILAHWCRQQTKEKLIVVVFISLVLMVFSTVFKNQGDSNEMVPFTLRHLRKKASFLRRFLTKARDRTLNVLVLVFLVLLTLEVFRQRVKSLVPHLTGLTQEMSCFVRHNESAARVVLEMGGPEAESFLGPGVAVALWEQHPGTPE